MVNISRCYPILAAIVLAVCFFVFGEAKAQAPDEIYGYVKDETTQLPVIGAEVWYCSSSVPEEFPQCLSQSLGRTGDNGKWILPNPLPNFYYRIWATKPLGAYSQTFAQFYSGESMAWPDLLMIGSSETSNLTLLYPNRGCLTTGVPLRVEWSTPLTNVDHFTIGWSDSEFIYNELALVSGSSRSYSGSRIMIPGWLRIAVVAQGSAGEFLGQDFSDAQVQFAIICPVTSLEAAKIRVTEITDQSARIRWETNVPAVSSVEYKIGTLARPDGFATAVTSSFTTSHDTYLTYLNPNTTYYYYIRLWDSSQNEVRTETHSFTTLSSPSAISPTFFPRVSSPAEEFKLPPPVKIENAADEKIAATLADGAGVTIPAGATISVGEGPYAAYVDPESKVILEIIPQAITALERAAKIIGKIYDIVIKNELGQEVRELQQEIEIILPYQDEDVLSQKSSEDDTFPSFFDETQNLWLKIADFTIDKVKNIIKARTKHLTRFAIVAAADITPPQAPTEITASLSLEGKVTLDWRNPSRDFHHAKIYRSEKKGDLGKILINEIYTQKFTDKNSKAGLTYYYTIRSVDPAGNESVNREQVVGKAVLPEQLEEVRFPWSVEEELLDQPATSSVEVRPGGIKLEEQQKLAEPDRIRPSGFFRRVWELILWFLRKIF